MLNIMADKFEKLIDIADNCVNSYLGEIVLYCLRCL